MITWVALAAVQLERALYLITSVCSLPPTAASFAFTMFAHPYENLTSVMLVSGNTLQVYLPAVTEELYDYC